MSTTFDLEKAKAWALSGKNLDKETSRASEKTLARHRSECLTSQKVNVSDLNEIKRIILESKEFESKYRNASFDNIRNIDSISMRVSGKKIEHGRIKFTDGMLGVNAFYSLLKNAVDNTVSKKKKSRENYLDNLYMLSPSAGSFIYNAEIKLFDNNDIDSYYTNRCVNLEFAKSICNLYECLNSINEYNVPSLISMGLNENICKSFYDIFSEDADNVDFDFNWANVGDPIPYKFDKKLVFKKKHRDRANYFHDKLKNIKIFKLKELPACIEKYKWLSNKDYGEISFKFKYKNKIFTSTIEIEEEKYIELKALPPKSIVMISGDFSMKENGKGGIFINKLISITQSNQQNLF